MHFSAIDIVFQIIVFLFAISVHESAHAWMASRLGDPTARMLGRVSLNPIKHIDPVGTILLPAIAMITHFPVIGWAKPTPVDPRNFRHYVRDDILVSVAGPVSNFLTAAVAIVGLIVVAHASQVGRLVVFALARGASTGELAQIMPSDAGAIVPVGALLYAAMVINVLLGVFNLIPIPPLDGSHVIRHFLSQGVLQVYDRVGMWGLVILMFFGGRVLGAFMYPVLNFFNGFLLGL
jgi:Zn-dependent protease